MAHGVNPAKILSISVMVDYNTNDYIHASYTLNPGYNFNWYLGNTTINVENIAGNSVSILSKPIRILITYEE